MHSLVNRGISSTTKIIALAAVAAIFSQGVFADTYNKGRHVEPAYEGWRPNDDGSFNFMFGYMNENWEEEPDMAVGDSNFFSPGDADRGQPTHFLPRRNRFTFEVTVPSDWGDRELVWTLNVNGVERKAYATLKPDYLVDNMVIASETGSLGAGTSSPESRSNIPPVVSVQGDVIRTVRVGEPLTLETHVVDDGLPTPTDRVTEARRFAEFVGGPAGRRIYYRRLHSRSSPADATDTGDSRQDQWLVPVMECVPWRRRREFRSATIETMGRYSHLRKFSLGSVVDTSASA